MTDFKEIDAQIAKKTAELETLRLELEQLQAKKSDLLRIERNGKEKRRKTEQQLKFEKDFDREKSTMTMPPLHNNGVLKNPVIRTKEEINEANERYSDADTLEEFGDIVDTSQHRHYGYTFVACTGLGAQWLNTTRNHDMVLDQEYGVTVPYEVCQYLTDSVTSYKNLERDACICVYELPYYDVTAQKYDAEPDQLYEYRRDDDFGDDWDLYVIYRDGSERKANLK